MITVFVALPSTPSHGAIDFMQKVFCIEKILIGFFFFFAYLLSSLDKRKTKLLVGFLILCCKNFCKIRAAYEGTL